MGFTGIYYEDLSRVSVVSHAHCLDGVGAACVMAEMCGTEKFFYCAPHKVDDVLMQAYYDPERVGPVITVDCSPSLEMCERIEKEMWPVYVIDHHASHRYLESFDFAMFRTDSCGTKLAYEVCSGAVGPDRGIARFVEVVDDYDLGRFLDVRSSDLALLCSTFGPGFIFDRRSFVRGLTILDLSEVTHTLPYLRREHDAIVEKTVRRARVKSVGFDGSMYDVAVAVTSPQYVNDVARALLNAYERVDAALCVKPSSKMVAARTTSDRTLDVSAVAEAHGGGGHRNAAAFPVSSAEMLELMSDD